LRGILAGLAKKHRDTPMAGRTHLQQALPVTFGYNAAIWLALFARHQQRIADLSKRVAVVEFAGAAGTLASRSDKGFDAQRAISEGLRVTMLIIATDEHGERETTGVRKRLLVPAHVADRRRADCPAHGDGDLLPDSI
jgi:adenylosuccinate lyase